MINWWEPTLSIQITDLQGINQMQAILSKFVRECKNRVDPLFDKLDRKMILSSPGLH